MLSGAGPQLSGCSLRGGQQRGCPLSSGQLSGCFEAGSRRVVVDRGYRTVTFRRKVGQSVVTLVVHQHPSMFPSDRFYDSVMRQSAAAPTRRLVAPLTFQYKRVKTSDLKSNMLLYFCISIQLTTTVDVCLLEDVQFR